MTEKGFQWGVKALQKKRAELAGQIGQLKLQLRDRRRDLRKVDDMIRLLAPGSDPTKIAPKKAIRYRNLFRQGERKRASLALDGNRFTFHFGRHALRQSHWILTNARHF